MKIFVGKNKKQVVATWLKYVAIAYLAASWGVNGVVNPLHYFKNATMQQTALECIQKAEGIVLARPQTAGMEEGGEAKSGFLSFQVVSTKNNPCNLRLEVQSTVGTAKEVKLKAWKGWNSVPLDQLCEGDNIWESFFVQNSTIESEELRLGQVSITSCRKVDIGKTVYLFGSFLFLAALWEGVWWIRKRYAET